MISTGYFVSILISKFSKIDLAVSLSFEIVTKPMCAKFLISFAESSAEEIFRLFLA